MDLAVGRLTRRRCILRTHPAEDPRAAPGVHDTVGGKLRSPAIDCNRPAGSLSFRSIATSSGEAMQCTSRFAPLLALLVAASALANRFARRATARRQRRAAFACRGRRSKAILSGDDATRDVFVYLPPSYSRDTRRRYPVVVLPARLHRDGRRLRGSSTCRKRPTARSRHGAREMIVVLPDSFTAYSGSMYSSSVTTGDWESYIADDLIAYVDAPLPHARAAREPGPERAFDGRLRHGAHRHEAPRRVRRALRDELVLLADRSRERRRRGHARRARARRSGAGKTRQQPRGDPILRQGSRTRCRRKPPLGRRTPTIRRSTSICRSRTASSIRWSRPSGWRTAPLLMVDQYVPSLKRYRAIALDVGNADPLRADNVNLDAALTRLRVPTSSKSTRAITATVFASGSLPRCCRSSRSSSTPPSDHLEGYLAKDGSHTANAARITLADGSKVFAGSAGPPAAPAPDAMAAVVCGFEQPAGDFCVLPAAAAPSRRLGVGAQPAPAASASPSPCRRRLRHARWPPGPAGPLAQERRRLPGSVHRLARRHELRRCRRAAAVGAPPAPRFEYTPAAAAEQQDRKRRGYEDPEARCHLPGVPRALDQPAGALPGADHPGRALRGAAARSHARRAHHPHGQQQASAQLLGVGRRLTRPLGGRHVRRRREQLQRPHLARHGRATSSTRTSTCSSASRCTIRDTILYEATVTDPTVFVKPVEMRFTLKRVPAEQQILEYSCLEGERSLQHYTDEDGGKKPRVAMRRSRSVRDGAPSLAARRPFGLRCAAQAPRRTRVAVRPARLWDGKTPDFRGIWQARGTAYVNIEGHPRPRRASRLGEHRRRSAGRKDSLQARRSRSAQPELRGRATADPSLKCYQAGVPRATYLATPAAGPAEPGQLRDRLSGESRIPCVPPRHAAALRPCRLVDGRHAVSLGRRHPGRGRRRAHRPGVVRPGRQLPRTDVHVVERYRMTGPDALEYEARIEEPPSTRGRGRCGRCWTVSSAAPGSSRTSA